MMEQEDKVFRAKKKAWDTTQHEREYLSILLTNKYFLKVNFARIDYGWMTSEARLFILQQISKTLEQNNSVIGKDSLLIEVDKTFDVEFESKKIAEYKEEIEIVCNTKAVENIDFITEKLKEADIATELADVLEESYLDLEKGDLETALEKIKVGSMSIGSVRKKENRIVRLHRDARGWIEEIEKRQKFPEKYTGIPTGFNKFDKLTGGLFSAELTIVFGLSGKGKSTVLKNMCSNMKQNGYNILHVANEENEFQIETKYHTLEYAKYSKKDPIEYNQFKRGSVEDTDLERWREFNREQKQKEGEIFIMEICQGEDASVIERAYYELEQQGVKIDVICIDYMDLMGPIRKAFSENDEQGKITNDCKQLAINCNVPVITATQAGTHTEKQETKERPFLSAQDIFGTKRKTHSANTLIGIINQTASVNVAERDESEANMHKMILCVPKNRDGPQFTFRQILDAPIGVMFDDEEADEEAEKAEQIVQAMQEGAELMEKDTNSVNDEYDDNIKHIKGIANVVKKQITELEDEGEIKTKITKKKQTNRILSMVSKLNK